MWFSIDTPNFLEIGSYAAELWRHSNFQDGGCQPYRIWFRVMAAHPRSASRGLHFILKFRLDRIYSFGDSAILYFVFLAWDCAETRRLSHKAWKSVQQLDLAACPRRRRRRQDKTVQKVTSVFYFTYLGRNPHWIDFHRNLHNSCRPRHNHVCKVLNSHLQG